MPLVSIPWRPSQRDLRIFAALQLVFCAMIALTLCQRSDACRFALALGGISTLFAILGLIRPLMIRWIYVAWMLVIYPIGWTISHLVVAMAYFGVVMPIGWLLRLCGHDPLQRYFDSQATTYWQPRPEPPKANRYFRQF
jgi:hypothetical protein